uniref:Uncharacterized protein n=1 Tax=Candidatus Kentrum sp. DK TaxID=2126562 RepID=A0A450SFZ2_9GAMM|nr:MAG: hypothetical protein BECKDK2373B_GA0170837_10352 [Candidatus Kentron sp. DK]
MDGPTPARYNPVPMSTLVSTFLAEAIKSLLSGAHFFWGLLFCLWIGWVRSLSDLG